MNAKSAPQIEDNSSVKLFQEPEYDPDLILKRNSAPNNKGENLIRIS